MELNKDKYFLTTNLRIAQYFKWLGFYMYRGTTPNGRELFYFDNCPELYEAFSFFKEMRTKINKK